MIQTSFALGDLLRVVVAKLTNASIEIPLQNETLWQKVFYSLKREFGGKFELLRDLRFDWDGPSPRSRELAEYIQALHWTGNISGSNPSWDRMTLAQDVASEWLEEIDTMSPEMRELTELAFEKAKAAFTS